MKVYEQGHAIFTRGALRISHLDDVIAGGYTVVNLTPHPCDTIQLRVPYLHIPVVDGELTPKNLHRAEMAAAEVIKRARLWQPMLIHCAAGRNRAPFIAALAWRQLNWTSGEKALDHVRSVRNGAIANPAFEEYLMGLPQLTGPEGG